FESPCELRCVHLWPAAHALGPLAGPRVSDQVPQPGPMPAMHRLAFPRADTRLQAPSSYPDRSRRTSRFRCIPFPLLPDGRTTPEHAHATSARPCLWELEQPLGRRSSWPSPSLVPLHIPLLLLATGEACLVRGLPNRIATLRRRT